MPALEVENLKVRFETHHGTVQAVRDVSFNLEQGETLGIVGESGSGKSVTSLAIMGLLPSPPAVVEANAIRLGDQNLLQLGKRQLRKLRGKQLAMIFQDPMTSLNPLLTVGLQLGEVLSQHEGLRGRKSRERCARALGEVGIPNPEARLDAYPHELSGGMRQRVMIAMGLLCNPQVLIADEPTTALDVTIQAQILELMKDLQERHGMAIILITHDLGVVAGMSDRIQVMYAGRVVEKADTVPLFQNPRHPYTRGLLQSVPRMGEAVSQRLDSIEGQPPDLSNLPVGCAFAERCDLAGPDCLRERPPLVALEEPDRHSACVRHAELRAEVAQ